MTNPSNKCCEKCHWLKNGCNNRICPCHSPTVPTPESGKRKGTLPTEEFYCSDCGESWTHKKKMRGYCPFHLHQATPHPESGVYKTRIIGKHICGPRCNQEQGHLYKMFTPPHKESVETGGWEQRIRRKYLLPLQGAYIEDRWAGDEMIEDIKELLSSTSLLTEKRVREEERERQYDLMMRSLPSDAENLSTLTPDQAYRLIKSFLEKKPWASLTNNTTRE